MRNVLARRAITPCGTSNEFSTFVTKTDRRAIELWFGRVSQLSVDIDVQPICDAPVKIPQLIFAERIVQRQHRNLVFDRTKRLDRRGTNPLGR